MKTYAVPDLHGRYDLFLEVLDAMAKDAGEPSKAVFLGDYVDRGPQSRQIIDALISGPALDGWEWICLKGNHEAMMVQCLRGEAPVHWWLGNGGGDTLASYGWQMGGYADLGLVPEEHVRWLDGLALMHVDAHRVFVHAGVEPSMPLDEQDEDVLLWKRYRPGDGRGHGHRHVVHGHTPFEDGPVLLENRTNLDTLAWATGRIVLGVFDDGKPGGPLYTIEIGRRRNAGAL